MKSLARPGGNSTGLSIMIAELGPKLLELLRGMVPGIKRVGVLVNPANPVSSAAAKNVSAAAESANVKVQRLDAGTPQEITEAFAAMVRGKAEGLIVPQESLFTQQNAQIVELAERHRLPTIGAAPKMRRLAS